MRRRADGGMDSRGQLHARIACCEQGDNGEGAEDSSSARWSHHRTASCMNHVVNHVLLVQHSNSENVVTGEDTAEPLMGSSISGPEQNATAA